MDRLLNYTSSLDTMGKERCGGYRGVVVGGVPDIDIWGWGCSTHIGYMSLVCIGERCCVCMCDVSQVELKKLRAVLETGEGLCV